MIILFNNRTMKNFTPLALLKKRVGQNYADFKTEILCLCDEEDIFEKAHRITAVKDCYEHITDESYNGLTDGEALFLLQFHNPLFIVADYLNPPVIEEDVEDALEDVINADGLEESYLTVEFAEELAAKHGDDVRTKVALLRETIEAGERYVRLLKLASDDVSDETDLYNELVNPFKPMDFDEDGFFIYEDDEEGCF